MINVRLWVGKTIHQKEFSFIIGACYIGSALEDNWASPLSNIELTLQQLFHSYHVYPRETLVLMYRELHRTWMFTREPSDY